MPIESILFLALVVGAVTVLAALLIYADWATRRAMKTSAPTLVHSASASERRTAAITQDHVTDKAA